ncbi:MAG: hypothetical protein COB85_09415 [Bacteroidetes bacterium]|nr:MAG: hypothetical protein COB85_09415 [Bacteroidota bacterium]
MKTNKLLFGTLIVLLIATIAFAQPGSRSGERLKNIESQKIAFITSKLDLTPEEAQKFWPVYNQCQKQQREMRDKNKPKSADGKRPNIDEMSDKEVEELINKRMDANQKELDIQRNCLEQYKRVLPIKKIAKLFQTEKQFKRELLKQMRTKREGQPRRMNQQNTY